MGGLMRNSLGIALMDTLLIMTNELKVSGLRFRA